MTSFQKDFDKELLNFFSEWKVLADYCDVSSLRDTSVVAVLVGNGRNGAKDVAPSLANAYKKLGKNNLAVVYIHELDGKGCGTGCDTGCMSKCASKRVDKAFEEAMPASWIKVSDPEGALLDNLCKAVDDVISENLFLISGDVTQVISDDAGFLVYKNEEHGFPWTAEAIREADDKKQAALESLRSSVFGTPGLKFLTDIPLYRHSPEEIVEVQSLLDCDLIGILFAADWSLPSQALIPRLAELYSGLLSAGKKIEIILVSSDENINVFEDHFSKMPWLAVRYTERDSRRQLSEIFKVSSVPTFVWVDVKSGEQLAVDGLETVTVGCEYFPWGDEQMATGRQDAITKSHSSTRLETHDLWKQNSQIILRDCRHHAEIEQDYTICFNEFATVIGGVQLQVGGKYYYEIEVVDIDYCPGAQLGWSSEGFKVSCLLIFFTFVQHTLFVSLLD